MYNFKLQNLQFKQFIDDIVINILFFGNFVSIEVIIKKKI